MCDNVFSQALLGRRVLALNEGTERSPNEQRVQFTQPRTVCVPKITLKREKKERSRSHQNMKDFIECAKLVLPAASVGTFMCAFSQMRGAQVT